MEPAPAAAENSKLRHVEKDVLIPQIMRDRAKELCSDKVQAFTKCCQETGVLMVVKCRQENAALKDCLVGYYSDPSFYEECKAEYLKQREEYRATGIKKKRQKFTPNVGGKVSSTPKEAPSPIALKPGIVKGCSSLWWKMLLLFRWSRSMQASR
uniref:COX assembly mitochondrial protein n=6 Tax=Passeriformes TaxID=9126 RepID=A0A8C9KSL0_SERCA